ncbi:MAG TPA: 16S rRNA (guanine(966)-N(2))-methyltransferase RsmD [Nocardioidaceae bacterium]|nr:16S rRNA (guanine(966)-N(2))-methyltransferase RsmD [Nocardioidaceae bacterium]
MTRIIGGTAGGRRIRTPTGEQTRPTSDRVREALFSAVDSAVGSLEGLRFLDLYAGSGAVGLEARSRGAGVVTLVERDRRTARLIHDNVGALGLSQVEVVVGGVSATLDVAPRAPYDIVFCDPPYALPEPDVADDLHALAGNDWLDAGTLVVVERSSRSPRPEWPMGYDVAPPRTYGETVLWFAVWYGRSALPPDAPPTGA